jgi:hypothetical protein
MFEAEIDFAGGDVLTRVPSSNLGKQITRVVPHRPLTSFLWVPRVVTQLIRGNEIPGCCRELART